jgi:hypothetical protein
VRKSCKCRDLDFSIDVKTVQLTTAGERESFKNGLAGAWGTSANFYAAARARTFWGAPRGAHFPRAHVDVRASASFCPTAWGARGPTAGC